MISLVVTESTHSVAQLVVGSPLFAQTVRLSIELISPTRAEMLLELLFVVRTSRTSVGPLSLEEERAGVYDVLSRTSSPPSEEVELNRRGDRVLAFAVGEELVD